MKPNQTTQISPGPIVLFGSGETSPSGQKVFDRLFRLLPDSPRVALLETPAGFELNSAQVIGRVGDFLQHHLQNYNPEVVVVPARKRGTVYSPNNLEIVKPLLTSDLIFMGPGSPTYAVRQLHDSLAWDFLLARHRLGAAIALASAATIAVGAYALPVYEIYKVGEDLHWKQGLDLFGHYGMSVVFIPHWNNREGGKELDTSRCFMGESRFSYLMDLLAVDLTVIGIDEHTALMIDPARRCCEVLGAGGITLIHSNHTQADSKSPDALLNPNLVQVAERRNAHVHRYQSGESFPLDDWFPFRLPEPGSGLDQDVWQHALENHRNLSAERTMEQQVDPPQEVLSLVEDRRAARENKDWKTADALRDQINKLGWQVQDTPQGQKLIPLARG